MYLSFSVHEIYYSWCFDEIWKIKYARKDTENISVKNHKEWRAAAKNDFRHFSPFFEKCCQSKFFFGRYIKMKPIKSFSVDKTAEISSRCRKILSVKKFCPLKFCPPKYFVCRNFCPLKILSDEVNISMLYRQSSQTNAPPLSSTTLLYIFILPSFLSSSILKLFVPNLVNNSRLIIHRWMY